MRIGASVLLIAWMLGLAGCASYFSASASKEITPAQFVKLYHVDPLDQMHYVGSDESHHYFFRSKLGRSASLKIRKTSFRLPIEFQLSEARKPLFLVGHFDAGSGSWVQKPGFE